MTANDFFIGFHPDTLPTVTQKVCRQLKTHTGDQTWEEEVSLIFYKYSFLVFSLKLTQSTATEDATQPPKHMGDHIGYNIGCPCGGPYGFCKQVPYGSHMGTPYGAYMGPIWATHMGPIWGLYISIITFM